MDWSTLDTWTAITAALAAMSCALPGTFLVLRKQSMLGDALSHTVLPGIVAAFLAAHWIKAAGWGHEGPAITPILMLAGAVLAGILTAFLTDVVQRLGRVENSAALGIVYTSLFAFGLLLIRLYADNVHIDAECVLFGAVETAPLETWGDTNIPVAVVLNGTTLLINAIVTLVCFKELRLTTFDPTLAESLGIRPAIVNYVLLSLTSVTLVAAFESVGSILVVTVLVTPASTAFLLTDRFRTMAVVSVALAGTAAVFGHVMAVVLPSRIFPALGFPTVNDSSTAGMAALACGLLFTAAFLFAPRKGIVTQSARQWLLSFRIACEDLLGLMYRSEEAERSVLRTDLQLFDHPRLISPVLRRLALWRLAHLGLVVESDGTYVLSKVGRETALRIVRSHRLWESYMARHFPLPEDHLHRSAARVEHFLDESLLATLEDELDRPGADPHGRAIPPASPPLDAG